jgi:hypothetical protein
MYSVYAVKIENAGRNVELGDLVIAVKPPYISFNIYRPYYKIFLVNGIYTEKTDVKSVSNKSIDMTMEFEKKDLEYVGRL